MAYTFLDYCDTGCFQAGDLNPLNPMNKAASWRIHGEWIQGAANISHAAMLWFRRRLYNGNACTHCHTQIRYAVALTDDQGAIHIVGEECAQKLQNDLNPEQWAEFKVARKIKKAKNGQFVYSQEAPQWFWDLKPRPAFTSISKYKPYGSRVEKWYLSIWGASPFEVTVNWRSLGKIQRRVVL